MLPFLRGLAAYGRYIAAGTASTVVIFKDVPSLAPLAPDAPNTCDAVYMPRAVNTSYSCICSIDGRHSFTLFWKSPFITRLLPEDRCHTYHVSETAARKFTGVGPTISWAGSVPVLGNNDARELEVGWGANGALLFGRQKTEVHHQGYGRYWPREALYGQAYLVCANQNTDGHRTNRSVIVPNLGGFAGVSYRWNNAKNFARLPRRCVFGAIDSGIDKRHSETLSMGGPFATISFGLGG